MTWRHIRKDIPHILATFWFGFWGAIATAMATLIIFFFLWEGLSLTYDQLMEGGLFFLIAFVLAYLLKSSGENIGQDSSPRVWQRWEWPFPRSPTT